MLVKINWRLDVGSLCEQVAQGWAALADMSVG